MLASQELGEDDADKRPTVQVGDPFTGKKLIEVSIELVESGLVESLQDCGAAGLASSLAEMAGDGIGEAGAATLKLVQAAALRMMRQDIAVQPVLATWDLLTQYLTAAMGHERTEQFRVLFLDGRNKLIADEVQGLGTINHAPAYPREVVRRCLELHASAVILAHNHPSGEPTPSREDVALTIEIVRAAALMGIAVHDHIIVGRGKWLSFREQKLI